MRNKHNHIIGMVCIASGIALVSTMFLTEAMLKLFVATLLIGCGSLLINK